MPKGEESSTPAPWSPAFPTPLPLALLYTILALALTYFFLRSQQNLNSAMTPQPAKKTAMIPQSAPPAKAPDPAKQDGPFKDRSKRHVSAMIKFLPEDEQQKKAEEVARGFKKMFADQAKWGPVMERMRKIVNEDDLRVVEKKKPEELGSGEEEKPVAPETVEKPSMKDMANLETPVAGETQRRSWLEMPKDVNEVPSAISTFEEGDITAVETRIAQLRVKKSMFMSTEQVPVANEKAAKDDTADTAKVEVPPTSEPRFRPNRRRPERLMATDEIPFATKTFNRSQTADVPTLPVESPLRSAKSMSLLAQNRALSTTRENWAVITSGPATPLSPTPTGNAFAIGGFWEALTPKTPAIPVLVTPVTAIPHSPYSPVVPRDPEARDAYNKVKREVEAMARTICAARMSAHTTISNSNDIPDSLLKPKDLLKAAQIIVKHRQVKLKSVIDPGLPGRLCTLAAEETQITRQHSIKDIPELLDTDEWLHIDETTFESTTIYDSQRDAMRMHQKRRKSKDLKMSDAAIHLAWAVRILEDAERVVANDDTSSTLSDEDKGYEYNNCIRSIKSEVSSSSDLASMTESLLSSGGTGMESFPSLSRETTWMSQSQRSSTSPRKSYGMSMRSQENSRGQSPSPEKPQRTSTSPRKPPGFPLRSRENSYSTTPCPDKRTSTAGLSRTTTLIKEEDEDESAPLTPEEKSFRHMGASHTDLNDWAQQLKDMEERQKTKMAVFAKFPALRDHPALQDPAALEDHPAFRFAPRDRSETVDETDSWRRSSASQHEREHSTSSTRNDVSPTRRLAAIVPLTPSEPESPAMPTRIPPPPPGYKYAPNPTGNASLHNSVRRKQHVRSKSSLARADELELEWREELRKMEMREKERQEEEMGMRRGRGGVE
jgi:hypothetical protein